MPQDVAFAIPFPAPVSPHLDHARSRHLEWIRERGLVRSEAGLREYLSWDLAQAAARTYPYAAAEDMVMLMNWFSLAFLFDDQFDAAASDHADRVADVAREMITVPFRPSGTPPDVVCPITLAWVEVWAWLCDGMSEAWLNRFASSWARFLAAHASEVRIAATGAELTLEQYLDLRRRTVGIHHSIDAAERSRRFEVPVQVQAHTLMQQLRASAADTIAFMNDIHSLEREERRGDPHNLVTVLRREYRCSRKTALEEAVRMTDHQLRTYLHLESRMPQLCEELRLTAQERTAVDAGVEGIRNWIRGNYDWALATGRYAVRKAGATATTERRGRGAVDDLLAPSPEAYARGWLGTAN
jgi:Terpene synthase family 2, C-terminal metal binding